jgi:hypothetical protein
MAASFVSKPRHGKSARKLWFEALNSIAAYKICLTGVLVATINPRNESTSGHNVAQYYYSRRTGSDAAWAPLTEGTRG